MAKKPAKKAAATKKPAQTNGSKANGSNGKAATKAESPATPENSEKPKDTPPQLTPEMAEKIAEVRTAVRKNFGTATMAMMMLPRYRNQTLADLQHLVVEPLIRDRLAIAYPNKKDQPDHADMTGFAIWASVSEEVDVRIREQIKAGAFPIRLSSEDWVSGDINWLLDVVAKDSQSTASVIANFKQLVKEGTLRLHPIISRLIDPETLKKMGAEKMTAPEPEAAKQ